MEARDCHLEVIERSAEKKLNISERLKGDALIRLGLDEATAAMEAQRCLRIRRCDSCGVCILFCPDSCITLGEDGHTIIDYKNCKGCGICAAICPKGAIDMVLEEQEEE